ncbi:MAG: hypothetical protein ABWZ43_08490, partial [Solirubrobacterales bacterium]
GTEGGAPVRGQVDEAGAERRQLRDHQDRDQGRAPGELRADEVGDPVTGRAAEGEDDRGQGGGA